MTTEKVHTYSYLLTYWTYHAVQPIRSRRSRRLTLPDLSPAVSIWVLDKGTYVRNWGVWDEPIVYQVNLTTVVARLWRVKVFQSKKSGVKRTRIFSREDAHERVGLHSEGNIVCYPGATRNHTSLGRHTTTSSRQSRVLYLPTVANSVSQSFLIEKTLKYIK